MAPGLFHVSGPYGFWRAHASAGLFTFLLLYSTSYNLIYKAKRHVFLEPTIISPHPFTVPGGNMVCSATWFQPSHPTSPRPPTVPRVNLAIIRGLLFFIALFAVVRQCWAHGRWHERFGLWIQRLWMRY